MDPRQRTGVLMFSGAAVGATGYFTALAVAPLAAEDLTGAVTWSGLPGALGIVGTALGATLVTSLLRRIGRRRGLAAAYVLGVVGAAVAVVALRVGAFPVLLVGTTLLGVGHAANQLTRYVVAELHEPDRRGRVLGWIVWAGTIGGVVGPNLLAPAGRLADAAGQPELVGPYVVSLVALGFVAVGYQLVLRPDPGSLAVSEALDEGAPEGGPPASAWSLPTVRVAIVVMVTGQVVMVWLMSMTPVHIRESGGDLGRIGLILSAHIFGMYALAPVAGWVEDRFGSLSAITVGLASLALSAVVAAVSPAGGVAMGVALFLLGLGWSFGFVAGSTMLARGVPAPIRAAVQGRVETVVFLASAAASLGAGLLLHAVGFVGLCMMALAALVLPAVYVLRSRGRLGPTEALADVSSSTPTGPDRVSPAVPRRTADRR